MFKIFLSNFGGVDVCFIWWMGSSCGRGLGVIRVCLFVHWEVRCELAPPRWSLAVESCWSVSTWLGLCALTFSLGPHWLGTDQEFSSKTWSQILQEKLPQCFWRPWEGWEISPVSSCPCARAWANSHFLSWGLAPFGSTKSSLKVLF